jgi:L-rhamnose isomerase
MTSEVLMWLDELLFSRGVRWDSDHVVTLTDDRRAIAEELVRGSYLELRTTLTRRCGMMDFVATASRAL